MNELVFNSDAGQTNPALVWLDQVSAAGLSGQELRGLAAVLGRIKNKADSVLCEVAAAVSQSGADGAGRGEIGAPAPGPHCFDLRGPRHRDGPGLR